MLQQVKGEGKLPALKLEALRACNLSSAEDSDLPGSAPSYRSRCVPPPSPVWLVDKPLNFSGLSRCMLISFRAGALH